MKSNLLGAVLIFFFTIIAIICLHLSSQESNSAISVAITCGGTFLSALFLFHPQIDKLTERNSTGVLQFSPTEGVKISWQVRSDQPIRTVFPEVPTDSTTNLDAKRLCNEARDIVRKKTKEENVDLSTALEKFQLAAEKDEKYWEPRINIAQIFLLTGELKKAYSEAQKIRSDFSEEPLAFAKAGLILARVIEQGISKDDGIDQRQKKYQLISKYLEENLDKCDNHLTSMISLGRIKILEGADDDEMVRYIKDASQYSGFTNAFRKALEREEMLEKFLEKFPTILKEEVDA